MVIPKRTESSPPAQDSSSSSATERPTTIFLPALDAINDRVIGSRVRQLKWAGGEITGKIESFRLRSVVGKTFTAESEEDLDSPVLVIPEKTTARGLPDLVLVSPDVTQISNNNSVWVRPKAASLKKDLESCVAETESVIRSWKDDFSFKIEKRAGGRSVEDGLRPPQIGALHAALAHWTISNDPATIVMPTGTGKTETMLALLVAARLTKVLVIVPSDALREQITKKFLGLGVLKKAGVISGKAKMPIVGTLSHRPKTPEDVDNFFKRCNVVVTTAQIAGGCSEDVMKRMATLCSHLFVDEAHHVRAPSWERVRNFFEGKPVMQFTATPYRGDGKLVDGKIIYNYPLHKAQAEDYFKPVNFIAVEEYNDEKSDERIATAAIAQLDADIEAGHDHLLMARCSGTREANLIYEKYKDLAGQHNPVIAHYGIALDERREAIRKLRERESRIVVCVDMFGEGFDLPELKIAALHDVHKSLAVTLQFTGRFTRTQPNVGEATVVANIADVHVEEALRELYAEDPDWNILLRELSEQATGDQVVRSDFLDGFTQLPKALALQNIFPKMSTVVYKTNCVNWRPEASASAVRNIYDKPAFHPEKGIFMFVTKEFVPVPWGELRNISQISYELYLMHWDKDNQLLYIYSSDKHTTHEVLAKLVCGDDAALIRGEKVYRVLHGINRIILTNLGLGHSLSRAVRHTQHMGSDVREGLANLENKYKTNLFGRGYASGDKASIGCSSKGRIWSHRVASDISNWMAWCKETGAKLLDDTIADSDVLSGVMFPEPVQDRPARAPITIEWSEDILNRNEETVDIKFGGVEVPFYEVDLELVDNNESGPIKFRLVSDAWSAVQPQFEVKFTGERVEYTSSETPEPVLILGRKEVPVSQYLQNEPPVIRFHDGSFLIYNDLYTPNHVRSPFDANRIEVRDWTGVNLRRESQGPEKHADSIQRNVINSLLALEGEDAFEIIFDDDSSGEAADIIAMRVKDREVRVHLYHCKYSQKATEGARVKDLYEVCGQAQKSVYWKGRAEHLIDHMLHREARRQENGGGTRFEKGDTKALKMMKRKLRAFKAEFDISIVQPGLSKSRAEAAQLDLLSATELYLKETYSVSLKVIANN